MKDHQLIPVYVKDIVHTFTHLSLSFKEDENVIYGERVYSHIEREYLEQIDADRWKTTTNAIKRHGRQYFIGINSKLFLHREDGPAYIRDCVSPGYAQYYLYGVRCQVKDIIAKIKCNMTKCAEFGNMYDL